MIGNVTRNSQTNGFMISTRKTENVDNSFEALLTETTEEKLMRNAPDKWVTEPAYSFKVVDAALDFKRNELGIEITEPTHELTEKQKEWLKSRHDFSNMQTSVRYSTKNDVSQQSGFMNTAEYSNFLADLAYLGIYSPEDFIQNIPLDTRPGSNSTLSEYVFNTQNSSNSLLDTTRKFVEYLEDMFNFYDERSKDPLRAVNGDAEFAALIKEYYLLPNQQFLELIKDLIENDDDQQIQISSVPHIEDCSEKLNEDFGKIFA